MFLSLQDLVERAEGEIIQAEGEAVIPLSDLLSLDLHTAHETATAAVQRLAALEDRPRFFALREWQGYRVQWQLDQLDPEQEADQAGVDAYWNLQTVLDAWEEFGEPLDLPPLHPYASAEVANGSVGAGRQKMLHIQNWVNTQRSLVNTIDRLLAAGMKAEVDQLAWTFEQNLKHARAHLRQLQAAGTEQP